MTFFGGTMVTLENSLDYASMKNKTIADNIANVDTPNYKAKNVSFKNVLHTELQRGFETKRTDDRHIDFSAQTGDQTYKTTTNRTTMYNHNGNNVDIDKEMAELAENQIYYQALVDRINGKFSSLQSVVRGGN